MSNDWTSNEPYVRDWMMAKESEIDGVEVPNAYWVIAYYFGQKAYNTVTTDPENFYLVLEPAVMTELPIAKKDMTRDTIFCATTYGWGWLDMIEIKIDHY